MKRDLQAGFGSLLARQSDLRVDSPASPRAAHGRQKRRALRVLMERYDERSVSGSCRPGCAACCEMHVTATTLEAEAIVWRLGDLEGRAALVELAAACGRRVAATAGITADEYWQRRLPCPLLGADRRCRVYDDRPFGCRSYVVASDPALCSVRPYAIVSHVVREDTSIASALGLLAGEELRSLNSVLLEVLTREGFGEASHAG